VKREGVKREKNRESVKREAVKCERKNRAVEQQKIPLIPPLSRGMIKIISLKKSLFSKEGQREICFF
jgi:hypothetical protein